MERYTFTQRFAAVEYLIEMGETRMSSAQRDGVEEGLICPKPRRIALGIFASPPPSRFSSHIPSLAESEAGNELWDILLSKAAVGDESKSGVYKQQGSIKTSIFMGAVGDESSPGVSFPYFCGSPPSRASNPLIHDLQFSLKKNAPPPLLNIHQQAPSYDSPFWIGSPRQKSSHNSFGSNPSVRIEGFAASSSPESNRGVLTLA